MISRTLSHRVASPLLALLLIATPALAASKADKAEGAALYKSTGCEHCHGATLAGTDEGVNLQGVGRSMSRADITHQIVKGGGGMPPFSDALTDQQIARLVDFLETQKKRPVKSKGTPVPVPAPKPKPDDDSGD